MNDDMTRLAEVASTIHIRNFSLHIAQLAERLARDAGEQIHRPLTQAQLARAVEVNRAETQLIQGLIEVRWADQQRNGELLFSSDQ